MREPAVLCLGPIQSWQTHIHFVFVFDFVPVFVFSIVSLVFVFVLHFAFLFVFAIVFERMDVNPWCCTTSSLSLTLQLCLFLSLTLCLYLSLTLCLSLTFCLCVKIKYLLRILGFLLNDGLWVKAICWDCTWFDYDFNYPCWCFCNRKIEIWGDQPPPQDTEHSLQGVQGVHEGHWSDYFIFYLSSIVPF